jgi:hypothetical protein
MSHLDGGFVSYFFTKGSGARERGAVTAAGAVLAASLRRPRGRKRVM